MLWTYFSSVWLTALSLPSLLDLACALCSPYALVCAPCDVLHRLHGDSRICTIPDMNDSIVLGLLIVLQTTKTHKEFEVLTGVRMTRDLLSV